MRNIWSLSVILTSLVALVAFQHLPLMYADAVPCLFAVLCPETHASRSCFRSQKQFRFPGPQSLCAGCFAAGTGFLLNFTIREHPPGTRHHRRTSVSGTDRPLAPDQHRLTDDGGSSISLPGKAVLKEDDKAHVVESFTPRRQEQHSQQSSLPQTPEPQPLLGAMAQIKVPIHTLRVDLEIIVGVDSPAISPLLSLSRCLSALRKRGKNGLCLLPSDKETCKGCVKRLLVSGAGLGSFQRVQEVHGYVYHHCQPEGHIPASGRHPTQVPSQVRFRGKNVS